MRPTERLIELISAKHDVLLRLRDFAPRQVELIASGDTTSLLKLLAVKQQLIASLQELERELSPYYDENPERRQWRSPAERAHCAKLASDCNELLRLILDTEKTSAETMVTRRNAVAEQLQQVHASHNVRHAYEAQRMSRS